MENKSNISTVTKFVTPTMMLTLASAIIWLIVEVKKIPTIDERLNKKIAIQNKMHDELDSFKMEITERIHKVEMSVKDEKIERLEAEIKRLSK